MLKEFHENIGVKDPFLILAHVFCALNQYSAFQICVFSVT